MSEQNLVPLFLTKKKKKMKKGHSVPKQVFQKGFPFSKQHTAESSSI